MLGPELAPIRLVRSRIVNTSEHGQVRVVVDRLPEDELYPVSTELLDSNELVFAEIFGTLTEATATLGSRFQRIVNRATAERRRAQEGEAA